MTEKWADYLISKVRYNAAETHIAAVLVHLDQGDSIGTGMEVDRPTIVERIARGSTFVTIFSSEPGKVKRGADVRVVTIEGTKYIRTDADATKKDNLGALPRF